MAPLSSCLISGIFSLSDGSRDTDLSYYVQYLSAVEFHDETKYINVSIRKFTPSAEALHADGSLVFLVAKAAFPPRDGGMLDSIYCVPFRPIEDLDQALPVEPTHVAFVTGVVSDVGNVSGSGVNRSFTLTVSEYVRDLRRAFEIRFEYNGTSNRWKNVRPPVTGSVVTATGSFCDTFGDGKGIPVLKLLDISYGATGEATATSPTRSIGHRKGQRSDTLGGPQASSSSPLQAAAGTDGGSFLPAESSRAAGKRKSEEVEASGDIPSSPLKRPRNRRVNKANA